MKFVRRIIAAVMVAAVSLTTLATTAFALGKDLVALSDDERFNEIWKEVDHSFAGLEASLMHDELKKFISELEITSIYGYDVDEGFKDFKEWYNNRHKGMKIDLYDKEVAAYLKEHPDSDLRWTDGAGAKQGELRVYDSNILVATVKDQKSRDVILFMQYSPENISNMIIWSYDVDKEQFIGNDENGKLVKKVPAYSKPYYYKSTDVSEKSEQSESSTTEASEDETVSEVQESTAVEMTVSEANSDKERSAESDANATVSEDRTDSADQSAIEESAVKADDDTAAVSEETVEADTSMVAEESPAQEENSNNDNSTTTIIIICGVVIVGVFTFLIVRQKKKKV